MTSWLEIESFLLMAKSKNRSVCTLAMSRRLYPRLANHKLDTAYRHLFGKIKTDIQRHRALDDAWMAARIWMKMEGIQYG